MHLITLQNHELVELSKEVQNLQRCLLYEYVTIMILNCFASYSVDLTSKSSKVCNFFLYPKLQTHIFCQNIVTRLLHSTPYTIVSKRRKNAVKKKITCESKDAVSLLDDLILFVSFSFFVSYLLWDLERFGWGKSVNLKSFYFFKYSWILAQISATWRGCWSPWVLLCNIAEQFHSE